MPRHTPHSSTDTGKFRFLRCTGVHEMFEANMVGVILVDHESETPIVAIREGTPEPTGLTRLVHRPACGYAEFEVVAGSDMRRTGAGVGLTRRLIGRTCAPEVPSLRKVAAITG